MHYDVSSSGLCFGRRKNTTRKRHDIECISNFLQSKKNDSMETSILLWQCINLTHHRLADIRTIEVIIAPSLVNHSHSQKKFSDAKQYTNSLNSHGASIQSALRWMHRKYFLSVFSFRRWWCNNEMFEHDHLFKFFLRTSAKNLLTQAALLFLFRLIGQRKHQRMFKFPNIIGWCLNSWIC